jgi:uncharacterized protein YchJ
MKGSLFPYTMYLEPVDHSVFMDTFDDNSPNIRTYGSSKVEKHSPAQWQELKKQPKIARNAPCPCGSDKKYKQCCLIA